VKAKSSQAEVKMEFTTKRLDKIAELRAEEATGKMAGRQSIEELVQGVGWR
jgi:ATP-dependent protease Clp ATPase subunit